MKKIYFISIGIIIIAIIAGFVWYYFGTSEMADRNAVSNFKECEAAGNPVGESYPRQCWTPDGKHFVEDISQDNPPVNNNITITGEITCLPKTGSGAQTLGLRSIL